MHWLKCFGLNATCKTGKFRKGESAAHVHFLKECRLS